MNKNSVQYLILYNVDIYMNKDMRVFIHPNEDVSYEYVDLYFKGKNDKPILEINTGHGVTNVKKAVIYVEGDDINYLYYEESNKSTYIEKEVNLKINHDPECTGEEDCQEKYGNPPKPYTGWECIDGECFFT